MSVLGLITTGPVGPISPTPEITGQPIANNSSMLSSSPSQNNEVLCPGGAAGVPQQQTPMMNLQGIQPMIFTLARRQGTFRNKIPNSQLNLVVS